MGTYEMLHHGPGHCILYHVIRPLSLVNISITGVYLDIQWNIYVKPF